MSGTPQRDPWNGDPTRLGDRFTFHKLFAARQAGVSRRRTLQRPDLVLR